MTTKTIQMYRTNLDGSETTLYPLTEAEYVTMDDGTTIEEALTNSDSSKYSPVIESSKAMFKVGEGDSVDLSESAIDGAYNSCVLKGKTMVNCIQEPSSQDVVLPYEFEEGQYVTINDTKESGALGVELKGQTLVNLLAYNIISKSSNTTFVKNGDTIVCENTVEAGWSQVNLGFAQQLKPLTKYLIKWDSIVWSNENFNPSTSFISLREMNTNTSCSFWANGKNYMIGTTLEDVSKMSLRIHTTVSDSLINTVTVKGLKVLEYQEGMENWDIPYFEGMASCKMPILTTIGKNINKYSQIDFLANSAWHDSVGTQSMYGDIGAKSKSRLLFRKGTYFISVTDKINVDVFQIVDDNENILVNNVNKEFTLTEDTFLTVRFRPLDYTGIMNISAKIQIEQEKHATTYEDHKSSSLSLPEEVVLRSLPNGVCDTFNTRTGVYTQRVGAMVLNGSDPISSRMEQTDNVLTTTSRCYLDYASIPSDISMKPFSSANGVSNKLICDILPVKAVVPNMQQDDIESVGQTTAGFSIRVKGKTIAECRQRLAEQPVTIQYELATPIITKINLSSTLKSWNTTTHIYSEIPENTLYPILSHSNATYPVILKPSTKYSIVANSYSNNHTNSTINFNLGGATASTTVGNRVTTITTPSTLSNELLTMSGRGNKLNNVMVIEGDVAGDEPYFEGICDCKSPILSNVGKNLVNPNNYINYPNNNISVKKDGEHSYILENKTTGNWRYQIGDKVKLKANTTYTLSYDYELLSESVPMNYGAVINLRDESNPNKNISGDAVKGKPRTFTTTEDVIVQLAMYITDTSGGINKIKYYNIQVVEAPTVLDYEPYKSNILSANGDKIELTEDMFEQGGTITTVGVLYQNNKESNNARLRLKDIVKVKPNTTYRLKLSDNYQGYVQTYNKEKLSTSNRLVWSNDIMFTTTSSEQYVVISIRYTNNSSISVGVLNSNIITLSEVDKTIVLRSLQNEVCDTLNVETGEYIQKIGEVVFDGSSDEEMWYNSNWANGDYVACYWNVNAMSLPNKKAGAQNMVCDSFPTVTSSIVNTGGIVTGEGIWGEAGSSVMYISVNKAKLTELNVTGFRQWASQNPVIVQYELETPIVSTIDIQGFPYAYKDGHVQLSSGSIEQSLTPKVEYSLVANRNGQIEANTKSIRRHQDKLDDFEALMLTQMIQTHYEKTLLQFDFEMQMMALGGE